MKKALSVFLVAAMIFMLLPVTVLGTAVETTTDANGALYEKKADYLGNEYYVFADCPNDAIIVTIPESLNGIPVTEIKSDAFAGCDSIVSIYIPKSITSIKGAAIAACSSIVQLTVDSANEAYYSQGNCILEKDTNVLVVGCKASVIPTDSKVTTIGDHAFDSCAGITKLVSQPTNEAGALYIPSNITTIGRDAFVLCYNLKSIELPDSVVKIDSYAFQFCYVLESLDLGDGLETIGRGSFSYCDVLPSVVIPESVTSIGAYAFDECPALTDVYFEAETLPEDMGTGWVSEEIETEIHLGYDAVTDDSYNTNGNVALGKKYDALGYATDGQWAADYTADLTDGKAARTVNFDNSWFAFCTSEGKNGVNAPNGVGTVTIDLEGAYDITSIKVNTAVGTNIEESGVNGAAKITAYVSDSADGEFTRVGDLTIGEAVNNVAWAELAAEATGRFVKIEFVLNGSFAFLNEIAVYGTEAIVEPEPEPEYMLGDVNLNGEFDTMDYFVLKRFYFGIYNLSDIAMKAGDINKNGEIQTMDYINIKRAYFGIFNLQ